MRKGGKKRNIRATGWAVCLLLTGTHGFMCAQDTIPPFSEPDFLDRDTTISVNDSIMSIYETLFFQSEDSVSVFISDAPTTARPVKKSEFKPNPKTAWKMSLVFPGLGQIYNRQYWKLPIVYGGLTGCAYAISWNNRTFQDYKNAYFGLMRDLKADPSGEHPESWSESWQVFIPSGIDPATRLNNPTFHANLKRGKDYYRRYRDLSIIITIGIYLICVADAYVDAQMYDFDVSPDLSFRITPEYRPETILHARTYGFNICMTF